MPLTPKNAQQFSTLHPRCGTSFLVLTFILSILVCTVFDWLMLYCMYDNGELSENERLQAVLRETEENDALGGDQP